MTTERIDDEVRGGVSRRSVVKAAAWSAPVIAVAVAAPAATASGGGTLAFAPGPGTLNIDTNNFFYSWTITNSSAGLPIAGPFTIEFNVPFGMQESLPKPPAGQASSPSPTLFGPITVSAPGYAASWIHADGISDAYGNTRTELVTIGDATTQLAAGASIVVTTEWTVPENWLSVGEGGGSVALDRRILTWRSEGTVTAASGTVGSPATFPSWTTDPAVANPASPGGLWAFSTPAG
ncbi:hypothetical protein ACWKWP_14725 [Agromyces soli]